MHSAFLASYTPSAPPEEFGTRGEDFNKDMDGTRCNHLLALAAGHTAADKRIAIPQGIDANGNGCLTASARIRFERRQRRKTPAGRE